MTYVMTPKRDILILGFRLDQIYTRAKAREEAMNGISRKGVIAYSSADLISEGWTNEEE
jgi:hypothetical protein